MTDHIMEWLSLLGRWAHIITGIAWIGSSFFFMWLDASLDEPKVKEDGVTGELFMVHGGGYYKVHKKLFGIGPMPKVLHWFKWEAGFTWITGVFTLGVIYYSGGATYMVDETIMNLSAAQAIGIGLFSLFGSYLIYDIIWVKIGHKKMLPTILTAMLVIGMTYLLANTLSGRAAYIHVGAMLGTWMVGNVWHHIIPNQRKMVDQAAAGQEVDYTLGNQAKYRSVHNNYFTLPVLFIMISNHHPMTYGHAYNWLLVFIMFFAGALIRHYFNQKNKGQNAKWALIPAALCIVLTIYITAPNDYLDEPEVNVTLPDKTPADLKREAGEFGSAPKVVSPGGEVNESTSDAGGGDATLSTVITKEGHGSLEVQINYKGEVPAPQKLKLPGACARQHKGNVYLDNFEVKNNKLKNVMVWLESPSIKEIDGSNLPEVEIDQKGCIYSPRINVAVVGQKVTFINSDPVLHNVKAMAKKNKSFNRGMPKKGQRMTKVFKKPELTIHAKCSLHPWMGSHIGVFSHRLAGVTNDLGVFKLKKVPAGNYMLHVWHEVLGKITQEVLIDPSKERKLSLEYK